MENRGNGPASFDMAGMATYSRGHKGAFPLTRRGTSPRSPDRRLSECNVQCLFQTRCSLHDASTVRRKPDGTSLLNPDAVSPGSKIVECNRGGCIEHDKSIGDCDRS